MAAELGLPFMLIWTFGVLRCLKRGSPHKRFAALAVLVQSLWDYSLSIPGNLWLFSYCAASTVPESSRAVNVPSRWKLPACLLVLGVAGVACRFLWLRWDAELLRASAVEEARAGASAERVMALLERSRQVSEHPETTRLAAEVELRLAQSDPRPERWLLSAAEHLQSSVRLDPYRRVDVEGAGGRVCSASGPTSPESLAWPARPPALGCDCHERALVGPSGGIPRRGFGDLDPCSIPPVLAARALAILGRHDLYPSSLAGAGRPVFPGRPSSVMGPHALFRHADGGDDAKRRLLSGAGPLLSFRFRCCRGGVSVPALLAGRLAGGALAEDAGAFARKRLDGRAALRFERRHDEPPAAAQSSVDLELGAGSVALLRPALLLGLALACSSWPAIRRSCWDRSS